jgi:predicted nicotinamide N-methyase
VTDDPQGRSRQGNRQASKRHGTAAGPIADWPQIERLVARFLEWYRTAHLVVRSNLSRIERCRQPILADRPEHSASPDGDAEAIFYQAVDRNFVTRLAMEIAATLGAIDRILAGVTGVRELASECEVDPDALKRLLRLLEARGIVEMTGDDLVQVTPAGEFLADSNLFAWRARLDQQGMGRRMDEAVFHGLLASIRTGQAAYEDVHGLPFWEDVKVRGLAGSFQDHMRPHVFDIANEVASLPEVVGAKTVLDVCGGDGALLHALLDRHPHLRGSLLELPEAAALARARFNNSGLGSRVSVCAGDVFANVPGPHDVCLLCWVLHDWSDEQAVRILETCTAATTSRGRIIVIERPRDGSWELLESDLRMLVFFGGRERSRDEWLGLFAEAGLTAVREAPVGTAGFVAYCLKRSDPTP